MQKGGEGVQIACTNACVVNGRRLNTIFVSGSSGIHNHVLVVTMQMSYCYPILTPKKYQLFSLGGYGRIGHIVLIYISGRGKQLLLVYHYVLISCVLTEMWAVTCVILKSPRHLLTPSLNKIFFLQKYMDIFQIFRTVILKIDNLFKHRLYH